MNGSGSGSGSMPTTCQSRMELRSLPSSSRRRVSFTSSLIGDDFTGRTWTVEVKPASAHRKEEKSDKDNERSEQRRKRDYDDETAFIRAYDKLAKKGEPVGYTRVRDLSSLGGNRSSAAFERLIAGNILERTTVTVEIGNGGKRTCVGMMRVRHDDEN